MSWKAILIWVQFIAAIYVRAEPAVLNGKIVLNRPGGPPIAGAIIGSAGANQVRSTQAGNFTLEFPQKAAGDQISLTVQYNGMSVVNDLLLTTNLPSDPESYIHTLILAKESDLEEMSLKFYRQKSMVEIEATFREKVKKEKEQEILSLRKERDEAIKAVGKIAEEFSKMKPEQMSLLSLQSMRLFSEGKIDEALGVLNESKLEQSTHDAVEKKLTIEKSLNEVAQGWLLRSRLLTIKLQLTEAEKSYKNAIDLVPDNFDVCIEYANFLSSLNRLAGALVRYERCLDIAEGQKRSDSKAKVLNNLGNIYSEQREIKKAYDSYSEALTIRRNLLQEEDILSNKASIAQILNNIGSLHREQNQWDNARNSFEESLSLFRSLSIQSPEEYLPMVAMVLNNLASLYRAQGRIGNAIKAYEEVLRIRRNAANVFPEGFKSELTITLNDLGVFYLELQDIGKANGFLEEALMIRRELVQGNPESHFPKLINTLNDISILYSIQGRTVEAETKLKEALSLLRGLVELSDIYLPQKALILNNLGNIYSQQNRLIEAKEAIEEAINIYRRMINIDRENISPKLANTLVSLGDVYVSLHFQKEAMSLFREALNIFQVFNRRNPDQFLREITALNEDIKKLENQR